MTREAYLMEHEAEFVEALNSYFPQDLIRKCVELAQKLRIELYGSLETVFPSGDYYAGTVTQGIDFPTQVFYPMV